MINKKRAPELSSEKVLADETDSKEQGLEERLNRYANAKKHQVSVIDHILSKDVFDFKGVFPERDIRSLRQCSSFLYFRHYYQVNKYRLIGGITCKKHFLCWPCALRRSAKFVKRYESIINKVLKDSSNLVPVLMTLTVKNESDLLERYEHIAKNYSKMINRRRQELNGRKTHTVLSKVKGGAGAIEIKRGKDSGKWHVHIHQIALVDPDSFTWKREYEEKSGKWIDVPVELQKELSQEWYKQTSDSHVVDVRGIDHSSEENLLRGIMEAFKYALKPGDMEIEDHVEAHMSLPGRRTVFSFGNLRGVKVDNLSDDIEEELKLLPYVDLVYRYSQSGESYKFHAETDLGALPEKKIKGNPDPRKSNLKNFCQSRFFSPDYINQWVNQKNIGIREVYE